MFLEVETKYNAENINLSDFIEYCKKLKPTKSKKVSSYDHYYTNADKFLRYRTGNHPQITAKKKLQGRKNNYKRIEVNINIGKDTTKEHMDTLCELIGFNHNFSIFKESIIFDYGDYNTVYYVIYDNEDRKTELNRFIEIEMNEDMPWKSAAEAWERLITIEQSFKRLGLTKRARESKSLFERFCKITRQLPNKFSKPENLLKK